MQTIGRPTFRDGNGRKRETGGLGFSGFTYKRNVFLSQRFFIVLLRYCFSKK